MKDYYDKAISYGTMRRALKRCCRNVRWKDSVVGYELHAPQNTHELIRALRSGTYQISPYQRFLVHEPKEREIVATRIQDRQVQMALCMAGLYQDITEHFIVDNCACQVGRGVDYCLKRLRIHMNRYYRRHGTHGWVLKCDIRHFFPSTPHDTAKAAIGKRIGDERVKQMVFDVIDSFGGDNGIGLGSQISQLVELSVLDDMDHFIKEQLHIKDYVRYMDDFILIHEDKEYLKYCKDVIGGYLRTIGLELNAKTTIYPLERGITFLKWHFHMKENGKIIQKIDNKKIGKERRKLRKLLEKEAAGEVEPGTAENSLTAWKANAMRGDAWITCKNMTYFYYDKKARMKNGNCRGKTAESAA